MVGDGYPSRGDETKRSVRESVIKNQRKIEGDGSVQEK